MGDVFGEIPQIPVVPSLGNNDVHPHNYLKYEERNFILAKYFHLWKNMIPISEERTFKQLGCFEAPLIPGKLSALSINTLYLSNSNRAVSDCSKEPRKVKFRAGDLVLEWTERKLKKASKRSVKIFLVGHIPPNSRNFGSNCYRRFQQLGVEYQDTIVAQYYGHMNIDHFFFPASQRKSSLSDFVLFKFPSWVNRYIGSLLNHFENIHKKKKVGTPVFVSGSVVPSYSPSIRTYEYWDGEENFGNIVNFQHYYMNLIEWNGRRNHEKREKPKFVLEYSLKEAYSVKSENYMSKNDWIELAYRICMDKKLKSLFLKHLLISK